MKTLFLITCLVYLSCTAYGARFLLLAHQFGSHMMINNAIAEDLPKRGHEVYVALGSSIKEPAAVKKMGYKVLPFFHPGKAEAVLDVDELTKKQIENSFSGKIDMITPSIWAQRECELIMEDQKFINQVKKLNFDMVIVDLFVVSYCLEMLPVSLGIPFVSVGPCIIEPIMRVPQPASFVPSIMVHATPDMSFVQRFQSFMFGALLAIPALSPFEKLKNTTLLRKYIKDPQIQNWLDLPLRSSMFFICAGPIAEPVAPSMPNIISIEGLTANPSLPLSKEFDDLVTAAPHGVVVVSFGSGVRNLPTDILQKFLGGFSKRKELFLWRIKIKKDSNIVIPSNVKIYEWLPQNDLLGHTQARLFITHSGNNGRYEAIYHGVPMLAFPLFGDQPHNALMIEDKGFGIAMKLRSFTSQELVTNMAKILDSDKYRENIKRASKLLRSKPRNARQEAADWMEHILEFGGSHLRNEPAMTMPYYQYAMWDIYGVIMLMMFVLLLTLLVFLRCIHKMFFVTAGKPKTD